MEFRTIVNINPSTFKITYFDPVVFIGSCFAASVGSKFEEGKMKVLINPSGTVYNPVSVCNTLESITRDKTYSVNDLVQYKNRWLSLDHYTNFSAEDPETVIKRINDITGKAREFFASATYLFITFGTSRVYRWKETGKIVSNCHKIPASYFSHELLGVEEITDIWKKWLDTLHKLYPHLKTVFTISPVRHWKDGAHGNQVSKSTLFLAVEELLKHSSCPGYFPAYEIFMDELRDYRFYDADMLHPSDTATEYIWERFTSTFFDTRTLELWNEVSKISRSIAHRIQSGTADEMKTFARSMLSKINAVLVKEPGLDLEKEKVYFLEMI